MARNCLSLAKKFSIRCRALQVSRSKSRGSLRFAFDGITAVFPAAAGGWMTRLCVESLFGDQHARLHRRQEVVGADQIVGLAASPEEPIGFPSASTKVWILVLNPPRDRPIA
jgi:hypothetical protein